MRATVELVVRGKTIEEVLDKANASYAVLMNNEDATEIPSDSEIRVKKEQAEDSVTASPDLIAYITIRTKLGA